MSVGGTDACIISINETHRERSDAEGQRPPGDRQSGKLAQVATGRLCTARVVNQVAATMAIARKLAEEFIERHARRCKFYDVDE